MNNVYFKIRKKPFLKMLFYGQICTLSLKVNIDNLSSVTVPPETTVPTNISDGIHVLRASLPFQGNELGAVIQEITIEPDKKYEIEYDTTVSWSTNSYQGHFFIKEI